MVEQVQMLGGLADPSKLATIWGQLKQIKDPEMPYISIVDLGLVRDVQIYDSYLLIVITPSYLGCPAGLEIEKKLKQQFAQYNVVVEQQFSPPWSIESISLVGREQLKSAGIAVPKIGQDRASCPQCGSDNNQKISDSDGSLCRSLYRCNDCIETFSQMKTLGKDATV